MDITKEFIRTLAAANGLTIPEERLEVVERQYESYLRTLDELQQLELPRERLAGSFADGHNATRSPETGDLELQIALVAGACNSSRNTSSRIPTY